MSDIVPLAQDHILFLVLAVLLPAGGWLSIQKIRRKVAAGIPHTTRVIDYRNNMLLMWSVTAFVIVNWMLVGRDAAVLGIVEPGGGYGYPGFALVLALSMLAFVYFSLHQVRRSPEAAKELLRDTRHFDFALPRTRGELKWFHALALTAGITEEILYRGFLIAYFGAWFSLPYAVLLSSLVFAGAHAYQGGGGVLRTLIVGSMLALMYVLSGSLLMPIVVHVLIDVIGGHAYFNARRRWRDEGTSEGGAARLGNGSEPLTEDREG